MSIKKSQTLKQLQSRKAKLEVEVNSVRGELSLVQSKYSSLNNQLKNICRQITDIENSKVSVTEHAVLRYMERAMGVEVENIKEIILTGAGESLIGEMGSGKYPIGGGLKAVVKGKSIVSII